VPVCATCGHQAAEAFRFCPECGAPAADAAHTREQRKTVTVLFCDVAGLTALGESTDPEALRALLARYFERMKAILESHGGTVEKFIGDAVMAVFGVPQVHENDALRACRAALEMRAALPELALQARIGLNTGEVVTGTQERLATGDAVNVAARLEQAAQPGEILLGSDTLALVGDAVETEPVESLELKGKAEPVTSFRLVGVREVPERHDAARFVGRKAELQTLRQAWERVRSEERCQLVSIVGDAGIGKSRLTAEFLSGIDVRAPRGRCLAYGKGITYWPVVEVIKQLDALPSDQAASASLRSLLGEGEQGTSAEEIAWAFRKLLEEQAPLVCVLDDIQWGEETFLDLVEHVALLSTRAPILLLCLARPDLVERRPEWPIALRLEPLPEDDVETLIPVTLAEDLRERIVHAAGGNPLFLTEMAALVDEGGGEVAVPPTLRALLAARLDQLEAQERSVLERGAVEGELFHRGAVQALAPENGQVTPRLASLVRKELIRPDRPQLPGEDAFRFRHLLIRDAAYDALPKATRAELHERFAVWLEERGGNLVELDEILGFHLERACRYRTELGLPEKEALARAARGRLTVAGRRANVRGDHDAATNLLERAVSLAPADEIDVALEIDLVDALFLAGRGDEAVRHAGALAERARAAGERIAALCGLIRRGHYRMSLEPEGAADELEVLTEEALPVFEAARDDLALYVAYPARGHVASVRAQIDAALDAFERAAAHARRAGLPYELLGWRAAFRLVGTTPVSELLAWLEAHKERGASEGWLGFLRARALARLGRFDEATATLAEACADMEERGDWYNLACSLSQDAVDVELLVGDPRAAVVAGEHGCRSLEEFGDRSLLSTSLGMLARACCLAGRLDEAESWAERADELGASDDALTQMLWRQAKATVLARRAHFEAAEALALEAVAIADRTDMIDCQGDAYCDLAEVLRLAGRTDEATAALEQALERYERKQNLAMVAQVKPKLEELRARVS
jgi:class 3 adenylate cyclase/tetratricopeptide (TPR) repeat protein